MDPREKLKFVQAIQAFRSKPELLHHLSDGKRLGSVRLKELIAGCHDAASILALLIPVLNNLLHPH